MTSIKFSTYISNTAWLMAGKIYRLGAVLIATILMARYLGPENFGDLNYALSLVIFFSFFVNLGLESLVVREILNKPKDENILLGAAFLMRLIGSIGLCIFSYVAIILLRPENVNTTILVVILSFAYMFKSFDVFRYWFEAHVKAKYSIAVECVAISVSVISKVFLILMQAPLIYFAWVVVVETMVMGLGFLVVYVFLGNTIKNLNSKIIKVRYLFSEAWPLILASALYIVYSKVDIIMLGEIDGNYSVGLYAAATKVSEGWFFIPVVIATSLFPLMLESRKKNREVYLEQTQKLLNLMVIIGTVAAFSLSLIANILIEFLFGKEYEGATLILIIHLWGGVFLAMNSISYRYFLAEGLQKYSFYRGSIGLIVNIALNLWLIPLYGGVGAAIATVLSQFMALYISNVANIKTRDMFKMQTRALFLIESPSTLKALYLYMSRK